MQLFLTLLRIMGILILAVILLVLLVMLLVLLCPVRYKAAVSMEPDKSPEAKVRVTWLLHLLSVRVDYREKLSYSLKVLGITLLKDDDVLAPKEKAGSVGEAGTGPKGTESGRTGTDGSKVGKSEGNGSEAEKPKDGDVKAGNAETESAEAGTAKSGESTAGKFGTDSSEVGKSEARNPGVGNAGTDNTETGTVVAGEPELGNARVEGSDSGNFQAGDSESVKRENVQTEGDEAGDSESGEPDKKKEKIPLLKRISDTVNRIAEFLAGLQEKIPEKIAKLLEKFAEFLEKISLWPDTILEKIESFQKKTDKLLRQLQDEQNQAAVKAVLGTVGALLKHIRPQKLKVTGRLGFDDPAKTGQIFGIIGMLMPLYGENVHLEAVFDEAVMEGQLEIKGRVRIGTVLSMALKLVFKREVRRLIAQVKRLKKA